MSLEHISASRRRVLPRAALISVLLLAAACYPSMRFFYRPVLTHSSADFMAALAVASGHEVVDGNSVFLLENGDAVFPDMLAAIRGAQSSIHFETFIFRDGAIGRSFADALAERARAGVDVRLLLDGIGSAGFGARNQTLLEDAGARVVFFRPIHHLLRLRKVHLRTHRKVLIVDGKVAFTGGICIDDAWAGDADRHDRWRDTMVRVQGPVVRHMQSTFARAWLEATGSLLSSSHLYPRQRVENGVACQLMDSSPGVAVNPARLSFLVAVESARDSLDVTNPYFVPDRATREALLRAAERGVRVRLLLTGPLTDAPVVRYVAHRYYRELLEAGIEIHEYAQARLHAKTVVVDRRWASVGSTNLDRRSFAWNYESNLNVFDVVFSAQLGGSFERDLEASRQVILEEWKKRPLMDRVRETVLGLVRSQL